MHTTMKVDFYEREWIIFRKCNLCWVYKELNNNNWAKNSHWFMWYLWRCKECRKKLSTTEEERAKFRIRDRNRYYNNPQRRAYMYKLISERRKLKKYDHIHLKTSRHIKKLWLRPDTCQFCGSKNRIVAHHPDYLKPFEIVFCCDICHKKIHSWEITNIESKIINVE